jgi:hypothetical protein
MKSSALILMSASLLLVACGQDDSTTDDLVGDAVEQDATGDSDADDAGGDSDTVDDATEEVTDAEPDADGSGAQDVESDGADGRTTPPTTTECFAPYVRIENFGPQYEQFEPVVGYHCLGTNHQDIQNVQKVVFFGDSVAAGTPPTPREGFFRTILTERLTERYGEDLVVENYSAFGARTDDLIRPSRQQFITAFPEPEPLTTLVIMTIGGNDLFKWVEMNTDGESKEAIFAKVDEAIQFMREAIEWLREPSRFPNGVYILFGNTYEFTDGTGNVGSCEAANALGIGAPWPDAPDALIRFNEAFMEIAVDTGSDMIFMQEEFCGRGFMAGTEEAVCDRGYTGEPWFDPTCIHPTPDGHLAIANMFWAVILE